MAKRFVGGAEGILNSADCMKSLIKSLVLFSKNGRN